MLDGQKKNVYMYEAVSCITQHTYIHTHACILCEAAHLCKAAPCLLLLVEEKLGNPELVPTLGVMIMKISTGIWFVVDQENWKNYDCVGKCQQEDCCRARK